MKIQKFTMFMFLMLGLQVMILQGAEEKKMPEVDEQQVQETPTLKKLSVEKILIDFNDKIIDNIQFNQQVFANWLNYITKYKVLFKHVINDDIFSQDGILILKKGKLLKNATENNNIQMVRLLLAAGVDVNIYDEEEEAEDEEDNGGAPLIIACNKGFLEIVQLFITSGANINLQNNLEKTALMYASENGFVEIVKLLLGAGADVNLQSDEGMTALIYACEGDFVDIVKLLLSAGANLNLLGYDRTALMSACERSFIEVVRLLLAVPTIHVNIKNYYEGYTALMYACKSDNVEIVKLLLAAGADITLVDEHGHTAEDMTKLALIKKLLAQARIAQEQELDAAIWF